MVTRSYKWDYITDGTNTLNGDEDCFPANTTITGNAIECDGYAEIAIHLKCNDVTTALTAKYEKSIDGKEWMDGEVSISNLDNNEQWIDVTDQAIHFIRLVIENTMAAETADVLAVVGMKS